MSSGARSSEPASIFLEQAPHSLSDTGDDEDDRAAAVALPAGLLRRLWFAVALLGLALVVIAVQIAQMPR